MAIGITVIWHGIGISCKKEEFELPQMSLFYVTKLSDEMDLDTKFRVYLNVQGVPKYLPYCEF
jgi:hypothetical protein